MAQVALEPQVGSGPDAAPAEIAGRSPWALAWRRFRRDKPAIGAAILFLLIVVVSFSAPLYAHRVAHVDPFANNLNGTTIVNGKKVPLLAQGGGKLGLGETPIGPTWDPHHYLLGAENWGRDVAARILYGGRNSLLIGIGAAVICSIVATILALIGGFYGGVSDSVLSRTMDVIWAFPVILFALCVGKCCLPLRTACRPARSTSPRRASGCQR